MMDATERPVWFAGELGDPWVAAIAEAIPGPVRRFDLAAGWPDLSAHDAPTPRVLVLHRAILTAGEAERLARLRADLIPAPRVVLCVGPHARHADLERWAGLFDAVVPEATARETVARHVAERVEPPRADGPGPRVWIVSGNHELRLTLADACAAFGYRPAPARDWREVDGEGLALWDVPVLEPDWPRRLSARSRGRTIVALLGFADRATVARARELGASACLELPCDLADLAFVLARLAARRAEPGHDVPPPPAARRPRDRRLAETGRDA